MPIQCDSSLVSQYEYNDSSWVLSLTLRGTGETRHYQEVSPEIFDEMLKSDSLGRYVSRNIFKKFPVLLDSDIPADAYAEQPASDSGVVTGSAQHVGPVTLLGGSVAKASPVGVEMYRDSTLYLDTSEIPVPRRDPLPNLTQSAPAIDPKKMDAVDKMAAAVTAMANRPVPAIRDQASYQAVQIEVNALKKDCKLFVELVDPFVKIAYKAYTDQLEKRDVR